MKTYFLGGKYSIKIEAHKNYERKIRTYQNCNDNTLELLAIIPGNLVPIFETKYGRNKLSGGWWQRTCKIEKDILKLSKIVYGKTIKITNVKRTNDCCQEGNS